MNGGSAALVEAQSAHPSQQLALPAPPEHTSPDPAPPPTFAPVQSVSSVSPPTAAVQIATAQPQSVAFVPRVHSHSLPAPPPSNAVPASPYHQTQVPQVPQVPLASQLQVQSAPPAVLSVLAYDTTTGTVFDPRSGLATKIKGGLTLASLAKMSNKFSPY